MTYSLYNLSSTRLIKPRLVGCSRFKPANNKYKLFNCDIEQNVRDVGGVGPGPDSWTTTSWGIQPQVQG